MRKRIFSTLLALCLVLSLLPATAFAAEGESTSLPEPVDGVITLTEKYQCDINNTYMVCY